MENTNVGNSVKNAPRYSYTVILDKEDWEGHIQTLYVPNINDNSVIYASPVPDDYIKYNQYAVVCVAQGQNSLTFECNSLPDSDLYVNILIFN